MLRTALAVTAVALAVVAVGCDAADEERGAEVGEGAAGFEVGEGEPLTVDRLAAEVDLICRELDVQVEELFGTAEPPEEERLSDVEAQQLVGRLLPLVDNALDKLQALTPPPEIEQRYERFITEADAVRDAIADATNDPEEAGRLVGTADDPFAEPVRALEGIGVTACAASP